MSHQRGYSRGSFPQDMKITFPDDDFPVIEDSFQKRLHQINDVANRSSSDSILVPIQSSEVVLRTTSVKSDSSLKSGYELDKGSSWSPIMDSLEYTAKPKSQTSSEDSAEFEDRSEVEGSDFQKGDLTSGSKRLKSSAMLGHARIRVLANAVVVVIGGEDPLSMRKACATDAKPPFEEMEECGDLTEDGRRILSCAEMNEAYKNNEISQHRDFIALLGKKIYFDDRTEFSAISGDENRPPGKKGDICPVKMEKTTFLTINPPEGFLLSGPFVDRSVVVEIEIKNIFGLPVSFQMMDIEFPLDYKFSKKRGVLIPGQIATIAIEFSSNRALKDKGIDEIRPSALMLVGSVVTDLSADPNDYSLVLQKNTLIKFFVVNDPDKLFQLLMDEIDEVAKYLGALKRLHNVANTICITLIFVCLFIIPGLFITKTLKKKQKRFYFI